jgi:cytochrome P450
MTATAAVPDAERHLAFGEGLRFCPGANLGQLEVQIAIAELARATPTAPIP